MPGLGFGTIDAPERIHRSASERRWGVLASGARSLLGFCVAPCSIMWRRALVKDNSVLW